MELKKKIIVAVLGLASGVPAMGQFTYGTTGLLNMPTADMQKDKTVMIGGGRLSKYATPYRWNYATWNYYLNITMFPWLEVNYTCTVFNEWIIRKGPIHMINQDRNFGARLRLWKEGWWKEWTPQIVVGVNDPTTGSGSDYIDMGIQGKGNGYYNRYFLAVTKHLKFNKVGDLGLHAAYVYNKRTQYKLNFWAVGANFSFDVPGEMWWTKALNGLNLMAEAYPANSQGGRKLVAFMETKHFSRGLHYGRFDINVGGCYSLWKDRINLYGHFYGCKDFSAGLQFKVCLK